MSIECHIITLHPDSDQTQELVRALVQQDVATRLFDAVDGRSGFPSLERNERIDHAKAIRRQLATPTASQLGCYLSHYRLIRSAFERGDEAICILEDDVMVELTFATVLRDLESRLDHFDLIRLMGLRIRKRKVIETLPDGIHQLVRPERGWCGCQCYVVTRSGMRKIIERGAAIYEPIDKLFDHFWEFDLEVLGLEPHVAFERPHESSVQQNAPGDRRVTPAAWLIYRLTKGLLSLRRHAYLQSHRQKHYPAKKPPVRPGRTLRMR